MPACSDMDMSVIENSLDTLGFVVLEANHQVFFLLGFFGCRKWFLWCKSRVDRTVAFVLSAVFEAWLRP